MVSPTLAAAASLAIICTMSSRTSPLPPGNWCEARIVTSAATAVTATQAAQAAAIALSNFMDSSSLCSCAGSSPAHRCAALL
jgi:hypothetical protein